MVRIKYTLDVSVQMGFLYLLLFHYFLFYLLLFRHKRADGVFLWASALDVCGEGFKQQSRLVKRSEN